MLETRELKWGLRRAKNEIQFLELRAKSEGLEVLGQRMKEMRVCIEKTEEIYVK